VVWRKLFRKQAEGMAGWRHERRIPALKKEEIREKAYQPE
jgi:hypothetical protein